MKKLFANLALCALTLAFACPFAGCTGPSATTIVVGASSTPHAEILAIAREDVEAAGYKLEIKVFEDYITPNTALEEGSLDANYFQHTPYLDTFNADYHTDLVSAGKIHYEPLGVYGKGVTEEDFAQNKTGRTILVPNDGSNLTRALFVLQENGYISLNADATPEKNLTVNDIAELNGNKVEPVEAATVSMHLSESSAGTIAVINGNYALAAGLDVTQALAVESAEGDAAQLYANIVAVRRGCEENEKTKVLLAALTTQRVYDYIQTTHNGAVLPVFTV